MALKSKNEIEEPIAEQISFDDIDFEAEHIDEESVKMQMEYLSIIIKDIDVGYFYSSEEYGKYVAQYLNIKNVVVDKNRVKCPINAEMIRSDLEKYKKFLNKQVWNDLINS